MASTPAKTTKSWAKLISDTANLAAVFPGCNADDLWAEGTLPGTFVPRYRADPWKMTAPIPELITESMAPEFAMRLVIRHPWRGNLPLGRPRVRMTGDIISFMAKLSDPDLLKYKVIVPAKGKSTWNSVVHAPARLHKLRPTSLQSALEAASLVLPTTDDVDGADDYRMVTLFRITRCIADYGTGYKGNVLYLHCSAHRDDFSTPDNFVRAAQLIIEVFSLRNIKRFTGLDDVVTASPGSLTTRTADGDTVHPFPLTTAIEPSTVVSYELKLIHDASGIVRYIEGKTLHMRRIPVFNDGYTDKTVSAPTVDLYDVASKLIERDGDESTSKHIEMRGFGFVEMYAYKWTTAPGESGTNVTFRKELSLRMFKIAESPTYITPVVVARPDAEITRESSRGVLENLADVF